MSPEMSLIIGLLCFAIGYGTRIVIERIES